MKIPCRLLFLVSAFPTWVAPSLRAQVRITEVTISSRNVEVTNFGTAPVNLSGWFFCHKFTYPGLSGTIAAGQSLQFTVNFNQTGSDLCLYSNNNFSNPAGMQDFLQWGTAGNGRESVATDPTKQIWTAGFFFAVPPTGKSLHAKGVTPATGTRTANWFPGWPHAGFPVPDMKF